MRSSTSAPGKAILFGEHAVVYGRPAIAVPLTDMRAYAEIQDSDGPLTIIVEDIDGLPIRWRRSAPASSDSLERITELVMAHYGLATADGEIRLRSDIPIASGLGSGAAVSAALARALAATLGRDLPPPQLNALVFEVEKLHHGTPSGIDNTVVVYEKPVYFVKSQPLEFLRIRDSLQLVLADTGIAALTRATVAHVRELAQRHAHQTEAIFGKIGSIAARARHCIETGDQAQLGKLMNQNHELLRALGVSSCELDTLVAAAVRAGARGAKLSGGGRGGFIIALVDAATSAAVCNSLLAAGAKSVFPTVVGGKAT